MSLDFYLCPKCGKHGLSWDGRAKTIMCLYHSCNYVIRDIEMAGGKPTETEMTAAIELNVKGE